MLKYVLCLERKGEQENHNAVFIASFPYFHSLIPRSSDIHIAWIQTQNSELDKHGLFPKSHCPPYVHIQTHISLVNIQSCNFKILFHLRHSCVRICMRGSILEGETEALSH